MRQDKAAEHTDRPDPVTPGLCEDCRHVRVVAGRQGARYYLCRLAATNPRFAKYPPLPVRWCTGYETTRR